jgi:excisionase family DNA binding protein
MDRLTMAEAAARLGISTDALRQRVRRGQLPAVRVSKRVFVLLPAADDGSDTVRTTGAAGQDTERTPTDPLADAVRLY